MKNSALLISIFASKFLFAMDAEEISYRKEKVVKVEQEHQQTLTSYFPPTLSGLEIGLMYAGNKLPYQNRYLEAESDRFGFTCPSYIDRAVLQCAFNFSDFFGSIKATYKVIKISGDEDGMPLYVDTIVDEKARQAFKRFSMSPSIMIDRGLR